MPEAVRLIVWDLDETFWKGTLTEGGITEYLVSNHEIVIELARRGILSSICSKNNFLSVKEILVERGIWDFFIFPSIDWSPKGQRVAAIVDAVQLRPQSVLFVDDNPNVLAEVSSVLPGIQVTSEKLLGSILSDPRFVGKDDQMFSRLNQYKLLEKKKNDQVESSGDNLAFLRSCEIQVSIETDVESHIDRAVELINRTNQLNFTKIRLPENYAAAKAELITEMRSFDRQAGLVRVADRYGDYGYCGFFLMQGHLAGDVQLQHFCFSCRTLGMGIESWLYDRLLRPRIQIVGEVLTNIYEQRKIDWISLVPANYVKEGKKIGSAKNARFDEVRMQGGCDVMALGHYFAMDFERHYMRTNTVRCGLGIRFDTSTHPILGLTFPTEQVAPILSIAGYQNEDLVEKLFAGSTERSLIIWSPGAGDLHLPFYENSKINGLIAPVISPYWNFLNPNIELDDAKRELNSKDLSEEVRQNIYKSIEVTKHSWTYLGSGLKEKQIKENYRNIFSKIPYNRQLFVLAPSRLKKDASGNLVERTDAVRYVGWIAEIARDFDSVAIIYVDDFIASGADIDIYPDHFERKTYHRIYEGVIARANSD